MIENMKIYKYRGKKVRIKKKKNFIIQNKSKP